MDTKILIELKNTICNYDLDKEDAKIVINDIKNEVCKMLKQNDNKKFLYEEQRIALQNILDLLGACDII